MATKTFVNGGTDNNWGTANNWSPSGVPANGDDVVFNATSPNGVVNVPTASLNSLTMTGYTNTLSGSSGITVAPASGAQVCTLAGTITWTGTLNLQPPAGGSITLTPSGSLTGLVVTGPGGAGASFILASNLVVTGSVSLNGNNATTGRLLVTSQTLGTQVKLTVPSGSAAGYSYVDFQDFDLFYSGGQIDLSAITGGSGDCGGNNATDMKFSPVQTDYLLAPPASGHNWSQWVWSLGRPPLPQEPVVCATSLGASAQQIVIDIPRNGGGWDFGQSTNLGTVNAGAYSPTIFGGIVWPANGGVFNTALTFQGRGTHRINTNGVHGSGYTFNGPGSHYSLYGSVVNVVGSDSFQQGSFDDRGYSYQSVQVSTVAGTSFTATGYWKLTGTGTVWPTPTAGTFNASGATFELNDASASGKTFQGGGKTYGNLLLTAGAGTGTFTITGSNTWNDFRRTGTAAHTIALTGTTQTCSTFQISGTSGNLVTLSGGTLSVAAGAIFVDYVTISGNTATGGATFTAGANSTGSGTGWTVGTTSTASTFVVQSVPTGRYKTAYTCYAELGGSCPTLGVTITPSVTGGGAGTFSPTSVSWSVGETGSKSFTYTPTTTAGSPHTITGGSISGLSGTSATMTVNTVDLTIQAVPASKRHDGTTTAYTFGGAAAVPIITQGSLQGSDTANFTEAYASSGSSSVTTTQITLTPSGTVNDGNSGNNYSYTFATLGTGVILPTLADPAVPVLSWPSGFSDWVDVTKAPYNADPTGTSDCATAFNNAINDILKPGGTYVPVKKALYIPLGTYLLNSTWSITGDTASQDSYGFRVIGSGSSTILKWNGSVNGTMLSVSNCGHHDLIGFVLDGNSKSALYGLKYDSPDFQTACRHRYLGFQNLQVGVYVANTANATADSVWWNCQWKNNTKGVVLFGQNVLDHFFDHCDFRGHSTAAVVITNSNSHYFYNSHFERNAVDLSGGPIGSTRSCSSRGSGQFIDGVPDVINLEDVWVDSWTGTLATFSPCINVSTSNALVFDLTFTNPPSSDAPIYLASGVKVMLSNGSTSTSSLTTNPAGGATTYTIPVGSYQGIVTGPDWTAFLTSVVLPTKVYDVTQSPYTADPTGATDSTTTINSAISAAQTYGAGAVVYFPNTGSGYYQVGSAGGAGGAMQVSGANVYLLGGGWRCLFRLTGGDTTGRYILSLAGVSNCKVEGLNFNTSILANAYSVYVSGTTSVIIDRTWVNDIVSNSGSTSPGLYLDTLPSGSLVSLPYVQGNITVNNCGQAKIRSSFYATLMTVKGTGSCVIGNLGSMVYDGQRSYTVSDGQSYVVSDLYVEQVPAGSTMLNLSGNQSNTLWTFCCNKAESSGGPYLAVDSSGNAPQVTLLTPNFQKDGNGTVPTLTVTNFPVSGSITLAIGVGEWSANAALSTGGTVTQDYQANIGTYALADAGSLSTYTAALDHLRRLRLTDQAMPDYGGVLTFSSTGGAIAGSLAAVVYAAAPGPGGGAVAGAGASISATDYVANGQGGAVAGAGATIIAGGTATPIGLLLALTRIPAIVLSFVGQGGVVGGSTGEVVSAYTPDPSGGAVGGSLAGTIASYTFAAAGGSLGGSVMTVAPVFAPPSSGGSTAGSMVTEATTGSTQSSMGGAVAGSVAGSGDGWTLAGQGGGVGGSIAVADPVYVPAPGGGTVGGAGAFATTAIVATPIGLLLALTRSTGYVVGAQGGSVAGGGGDVVAVYVPPPGGGAVAGGPMAATADDNPTVGGGGIAGSPGAFVATYPFAAIGGILAGSLAGLSPVYYGMPGGPAGGSVAGSGADVLPNYAPPPSGGAVVGSAATFFGSYLDIAAAASGGAVAGSGGGVATEYVPAVGGGAVAGSPAAFVATWTLAAAGGGLGGSIATVAPVYIPAPSGGTVAGSQADITTLAPSYAVGAVGGAVVGGPGTFAATWTFAAGGGAAAGSFASALTTGAAVFEAGVTRVWIEPARGVVWQEPARGNVWS